MNNRKHNTHLSQSDIALQIESLVQTIEHSDIPAFRITHKRSGYEQVEQTRLSRYFTNVQQMYNLFDDRVPYDYSEHSMRSTPLSTSTASTPRCARVPCE